MKLLLKITAGGRGEREMFVLMHPHEAVVGRDREADVRIAGDPKISSRHFRVFPKEGGWCLEDLRSSNGTLVNDQRKATCVLQDGDRITAGDTQFVVDIQGGDRSSAQAVRSSWEIDGEDSAVDRARRGRLHVPFTSETTMTGIHVCQGNLEKIEPAKLVKVLRGSRKMVPWLIADFRKLGGGPPPELADAAQPIVDWIGGPDVARSFPMLISLAERPPDEWESLVNEGWDQDALMIIFSRKSPEETLAHWRGLARDAKGGIVGIVWPGVLSSLLPFNQLGKKLIDGLDGILTELPDLPQQWRLWTRKDRSSLLKKLGFIKKADRPDPPLPPDPNDSVEPSEALDTKKD